MKVVFDTNVLISAFITRGRCSEVFEHCVRRHALITSEFILGEFEDHLVHKFNFSVEEAEEAVKLLRSKMEVVVPAELGTIVCRDTSDDKILGTAIAGGASCIITGDNDLLAIEQYCKIDIVLPAKFSEYEAEKIKETT
jgi:putative PIN family toxin of toxin-antitoxin system